MEKINTNDVKIMMIDEDISTMNMLSIFLKKYNEKLYPFSDPISAIEALKKEHFDILIVNYIMFPVNGDKIVELVRNFNKEIYIIMLALNKDLVPSIDALQKLDIQAYFEKNSRFDQLILGIQSGVKYTQQLNKIQNMHSQLEHNVIDFANVLLKTINAKDNYTGDHCQRVSEYCARLADYINLSAEEKHSLTLAALFHDIGKIGIPDNILTKTSRLTDEEYDIIKLHPTISSNILSVSSFFKDIAYIVLCHHERIDGKGYPNGLKEDEIPRLTKLLSICDTFDAITTKRSYKEALSIDIAIKELSKVKGTQLDKEFTEKFIELINLDKNNFIIHK